MIEDQGRREAAAREGNAARLVRPEVRRLAGYVPGEQPGDERVIKLNTNENPYPPSPRVAAAVAAAATRLHLYPDPSARHLRERIASLLGHPAEGVLVGNGSDEILALLVRAVVSPGDEVAFPAPTYSLYETLVEAQGGRVRSVPFPADFSLPADLFEGGPRLRFVCNPNSPSGTRAGEVDLERLARARPEALLVVDEAYVDFADADAARLARDLPNVVVVRTLSKSYSLAGLRVGFALASPSLVRELDKLRDSYNLGRLAQAGALAALEDQEAMRANVARVRRTRERLTAGLERLGFAVPPSEANFVLARRAGRPSAPIASALRARGILVRAFPSLPDALRITVGTDEQIDALLDALAAVMAAA